MAGNEEHPFASIVAAYHESQAPARVADEAALETAPVETPADQTVAEPVVAAMPFEESTGGTEPVADAAPAEAPTAVAPESERTPKTEPEVVADSATEPEASATEAPATEQPAAADAAPPEQVAEQPSALVDPFKSILAAYYAESLAEAVTPQPELRTGVEPAPVPEAATAAEAAAPVEEMATAEAVAPVDEPAAAAPVAPADPEPEPAAAVEAVEEPPVEESTVQEPPVEEPPVAEPAVEESTVQEPPVEEPPVAEPAVAESTVEESAVEDPAIEEAAPVEQESSEASPSRRSARADASGAAASVLAAYYADAPAEPVVPSGFDLSAAEFTPPTEATAVLPSVTPEVVRGDLPKDPSNPLGAGPQSANWGAEALAAAGSTVPTVPVADAQADSVADVTARLRAVPDVDAPAEDTTTAERKNGRRTFLMLAPVAAIAAIAVLILLLWNGDKNTPKSPPPSPSSSPTIILTGGPLKQSQEAYASALSRFSHANDAGGAVVAGGAAHDTLKLLKDFKGATGQDKSLLAAERAHLTSLYNLSTASPSGFAGVAGQAKATLAAVQKAAGADAQAKAPNSSPATTQAINLLGSGNVSKLQSTLNGLVAQADSASLTYQLRSVGSSAAGNSDAASSLASVVTGSGQATASTLAGQFTALAPLVRITADTLSDWSNIRPAVVSALGTNPAAHIDSLIANAQQKIAAWQAQQGNNSNTQAINAYANAMRSHFGAFGSALSQIPSLNAGETCSAGAKDGTRSRAGNAALAVNNAAFGGNPPAALVAAHNALVNAINTGTTAATAGQNVTVLCGSGTYGATSWGTYFRNVWIKGGWGGKVGAWESAVASALHQASAAGTKPVV